MLAIALSAMPFGAVAAEPPAPCGPTMAGPNGPPPPDMAQMQQMHAQMLQVSVAMRTAMLQAITAQHRAMLAQTIGTLAITPDPNYDAAAKQIDAALSAQEAQAIIRVATQFHQQMHAMMAAHMQRIDAQMTQTMPGQSGQVKTQTRVDDDGNHAIDPGHALLMLGSAGPREMHRMIIEKTETQ